MGHDDVLAFDVGGANIKAADGLGWVHSEPFELWRRRPELAGVLGRIVAERRPRRVVVTMTGEIADCYGSRREGVADIVAAVVAAVRRAAEVGCEVGVYLVNGAIVPPEAAVRRPLEAAASNWHAAARLAAVAAGPGRALVIDVGSTTSDIVPLVDGEIRATAGDDGGRLLAGELVYTGVERTPVAAVVRELPWRGCVRPVASERFADSLDAWLLLRGVPEAAAGSAMTADGGPATRAAAGRRMARMILADPDAVTEEEAVAMAEWVADAQAGLVARALERVAVAQGGAPRVAILSGHGGCLARRSLGKVGWAVEVMSTADWLGAAVSRALPAHALAAIARGDVR